MALLFILKLVPNFMLRNFMLRGVNIELLFINICFNNFLYRYIFIVVTLIDRKY